jgi:hypothetical protein
MLYMPMLGNVLDFFPGEAPGTYSLEG